MRSKACIQKDRFFLRSQTVFQFLAWRVLRFLFYHPNFFVNRFLIIGPRFNRVSWPARAKVCPICSPHHCGVFVFSLASRRPSSAVVRRRPPSSAAARFSSHTTHLTQLISQLLISHHSSHTTHLTHNSSHTSHLTQLISHNSSHTIHLTQFISHNSSHTQLISYNSSHTTHLTHLISQTCCLAGAVHRAF